MNKKALSDWAGPLFKWFADVEDAAKNTLGDASMLNAVAKLADDIPIPDFISLADDMAQEMERAAGAQLETEIIKQDSISRYSVDNPGFAPLADAIAKIAAKTPIASKLRTVEWARVPLALRERGQFSAGVESIRVMGEVQKKILARVSHARELLENGKEAYVSRESFILDMRQIAIDEGLDTGAGNVLTNIGAPKRLGLIYDMQNQQAAGYARWKVDNDKDALAILPAWRLGQSTADKPRGDDFWWGRWREAGIAVGWAGASQSEMVALKTSPIWMKLSRFGSPWPPFDFGSTRELDDVWRDEAEALGLVTPEDTIEPTAERDFNEELEASVSDWRPDQVSTLKLAFGDQVDDKGGRIMWQGAKLGDLAADVFDYGLDRPFDNKLFKGRSLNLGRATDSAIRAAAKAGIDIIDKSMVVTPDTVYHMQKQHGPGREKAQDQRALAKLDIEMLPHVWRDPDRVTVDKEGIIFEKNILGRLQVVGFDSNKNEVFLPVSVRVKK